MVTGEYASNVDGEHEDEEVRRAVESSEPVVGDGDRRMSPLKDVGGGGSQGVAVQDGQFTEEDEDGEEEAETAATTLEDAADDGVVRAVSLSENVESSGLYPAVVAKEIFSPPSTLCEDLKQLQQVNTDARVEQAIEEWFDDEHSKLTNQGYTPFLHPEISHTVDESNEGTEVEGSVEFEKMVLTAIRRIEKATQELDDAIQFGKTLSLSQTQRDKQVDVQ